MWKAIVRRWQVKLTFLGLAILGVCLDHFIEGADLRVAIYVSLIFVIIIFIFEQIYEVNESQEEHKRIFLDRFQQMDAQREKTNAELNVRLLELTSRIHLQERQDAILKAILEHKGLIGIGLNQLHEAFWKTVEPHKNGYRILDHSTAIKNYTELWRNLKDEQESRKSLKQPGLTALVVHVCKIEIFQARETRDIFQFQQKFHEDGGEIRRILCGDSDEPPPEYVQVADDMANAQVEVKYFSKKQGVMIHNFDFKWDFLVVKELALAVIWKCGWDGYIEEALITNREDHNGKKLVDLWQELSDKATKFDAAHNSDQANGTNQPGAQTA